MMMGRNRVAILPPPGRATTTSSSHRDRGTQVHDMMWTARMMWMVCITFLKARHDPPGRSHAVANRDDDGTKRGCESREAHLLVLVPPPPAWHREFAHAKRPLLVCATPRVFGDWGHMQSVVSPSAPSRARITLHFGHQVVAGFAESDVDQRQGLNMRQLQSEEKMRCGPESRFATA